MQVYYSPSEQNKRIVAKISKLPKFSKVAFRELPEDESLRTATLCLIPGRCAFIWGDGLSHQESYYFTLNDGTKLKINFDDHTDNNHLVPNLSCSNHMSFTAEQKNVLLVPSKSERQFPNRFYMLYLKSLLESSNYGVGEISLTVDFDAFRRMPVCSCWLNEHGASYPLVVDLIKKLSTKLGRLDLGGISNIEHDFQRMDKPAYFDLHDLCSVYGYLDTNFVAIPLKTDPNTPNLSQQSRIDLFNRVMSYAANAYADVLAAFFSL